MYGTLMAARADTLILAGADGDSLSVDRHTIAHVDVDRTRRHWWSGTIATCVLAASYVGLTSMEAAQDGWSWRMAYGFLASALWGKECIDTRPKWTTARIEGSQQALDLSRASYSPAPSSGPKPQFSSTIDSIATWVDLPPLYQESLPEGYRELRVWDGFGLIIPYGFLRIVMRDEVVGGDLYLWSYGDDPPPNCQAGVVRPHGGPEICRVESSAFHWRAVLDSLEAHRVWTLPRQEPEKIGVDGWYLVVETRDEGVYRAYDYWYPEAEDGPAGRDAQAIMNLMWDLSPRVD